MRLFWSFLLAAALLPAAEDAWKKVQDLKTGTEIRVLKKGSMKPLIGTFDEADADRLVIVIKNEQSAVARTDVDRLDYRPPKPGGRVTKETINRNGLEAQPPPRGAPTGTEGMNNSSSTSMIVVNKPDFETLYRRPPIAPK